MFWYCSRALLSTDQWVADSSTNARVQVCYHCHCELGFNWINPGSRRRQRFFSSFIISFNLIAYFVTFVWITNYHHRHHHIHHHLTGLVVPLLLTRVAFMWAEASARTRSIFHLTIILTKVFWIISMCRQFLAQLSAMILKQTNGRNWSTWKRLASLFCYYWATFNA